MTERDEAKAARRQRSLRIEQVNVTYVSLSFGPASVTTLEELDVFIEQAKSFGANDATKIRTRQEPLNGLTLVVEIDNGQPA